MWLFAREEVEDTAITLPSPAEEGRQREKDKRVQWVGRPRQTAQLIRDPLLRQTKEKALSA